MSKDLEGFEEVMAALDGLADTSRLEAALSKACAIVEADAKKKAPKDNGDLRRSISSRVKGESGIVFTPLLYAPYVEYGTGLFAENGGRQDVPWIYQDDKGNWHSTSGQHPHPFMRPAIYENREKIVRILKEGMQND